MAAGAWNISMTKALGFRTDRADVSGGIFTQSAHITSRPYSSLYRGYNPTHYLAGVHQHPVSPNTPPHVIVGPFDEEEDTDATGSVLMINSSTASTPYSTGYSTSNMMLQYVDILGDVNASLCNNPHQQMDGADSLLLGHDMTNKPLHNGPNPDAAFHTSHGEIRGRLNSKGSSPDLVLSSRLKSDGILCDRANSSDVHREGLSSHNAPSQSISTTDVSIHDGIWAGTPWSGFRSFRGDLYSKCARFIQDYILHTFNNNANHQSKSHVY